jgi:hypothetical protein
VQRGPRRHHLVQHDPAGIGCRQRRRTCVLPVRSSASRRRRSHGAVAHRSQGAACRAARECNVTPAVLRSSDRARPGIS